MRDTTLVSQQESRPARGRFRSASQNARPLSLVPLLALIIPLCGCTSVRQYVHTGFKVGPDYGRPPAPLAPQWIDAADQRLRSDRDDPVQWWTVFSDPVLDGLICAAYHQNVTLREAGCRVLEARAQLAIATGQFFPQTQTMTGSYSRNALSRETANGQFITQPFTSQWNYGFNVAWELDFWGRFRRAIESNSAALDASVEDYDDTLVTLLSDVATDYVQIRTLQERIRYTQENVRLQQSTLTIAEAHFRGGTAGELDVYQARSTLEQTEAQIPEFEIALRQTINNLCILLGMPPEDLEPRLGLRPIPSTLPDVAVGMPADLLRRRPDVRRAERQAAAQSAQIGVAQSDFYPAITINGTLGYSAQFFPDLFRSSALNGNVGPSFRWALLNYGRILSNVRFQDAKFQELVAAYQQTVLSAEQEVENGLVTFLRAQRRTNRQAAAVADLEKALEIVLAQYKAGTTDFTRVTQVEQTLVLQQDVLAQARGEIATGLIQVYRALGGGWQLRLTDCPPTALPAATLPAASAEAVTTPTPNDASTPAEPAGAKPDP